MIRNLTPRRLTILLTGILFASYSAYNVFIVFRDYHSLPSEGVLISAAVALLFAVFAAFIWTAEVRQRRGPFQKIRRMAFSIALLAVFALKLRMIHRVAGIFDPSMLYTYLYCGAYFMTLAALLILFIYYVFIRRIIILHVKAAVTLPVIVIVLFACSLAAEVILFIVYGIRSEATTLRTVVMCPVFYLSFIGLCKYFLYPSDPLPKKPQKKKKTVQPSEEPAK